MRQRLAESALFVFAEKGVYASVIEDVILEAKVSRGTFYYYFKTQQDLLQAVSEELLNETLTLIERVVGQYPDPARRIVTGLRLYLHTASRFPVFARFVSQTAFEVDSPGNRFYEFLPVHLQLASSMGRLKAVPLEVALDMLAGTGLLALHRMAIGHAPRDYPDQLVCTLIQALGLAESEAISMVAEALPAMDPPAESLLVRSHLRRGASLKRLSQVSGTDDGA